VEKVYRIDNAGNIDVERDWILTNQTHKDVDISELSLYIIEHINTLANVKASDSSGDLEFYQEQSGSGIKIGVLPRIKKLSSLQKYRTSLLYRLPNHVRKLGKVWFFSDLISGIEKLSFEDLISDKMDIKLQVILPNLRKRFWQSLFHESAPLGKELAKAEIDPQYMDNTVLEWTSSLFPERNFVVRLIYGTKTNTQLTSILTVVATAIAAGLIKYLFDLL